MDLNDYKQYEPVFGSWHITRLIGEGSFGKVFEMEREDFGVTYKSALKAITVPASEAELLDVMADGMDETSVRNYYNAFVRELVKEFALMSKLKGNSNVVSYEDHQVIEHRDGIGWDILIRMELLTPLNKYTSTHAVTRRDVIRLGVDLCKALELCRKHSIIHRDVKPENIFISESGDFKLGDFGIARIAEKTASGLSKKGTYTYMAPEVYKGEPYGSTVDIYSLGIVLYRLLNDNRTPFLPAYPAPITHTDRENALVRRFSGAPLPPPVRAGGRLAEIVLKACAYDPKERYSSPAQMRQELEAILYSREEGRGGESGAQTGGVTREGDKPRIDPTVTAGGATVAVRGPDGAVRRPANPPERQPAPHTGTKQLLIGAACVLLALCAVLFLNFMLFRGGTDGAVSGSAAETGHDNAVDEKAGPDDADGDPVEESDHEDGDTATQYYYNEDGTLEASFEYDAAGNQIKSSYYNEDGTLNSYEMYEYDAAGNRIKDSYYHGDGTLKSYEMYEYDAAGNRIRISYYNGDGTLATSITSEYDAAGKTVKEIVYDGDGTLNRFYTYEYDSAGNLAKRSCYNADGTLNSYEIPEYSADGNSVWSHLYDADGNLIV